MDRNNKQHPTGGAGQLRPAVTAVTVTLPPMTLTEWYRLPAVVRYFHPYERARRALVIDAVTKRAAEPAPLGIVKSLPSRQVRHG